MLRRCCSHVDAALPVSVKINTDVVREAAAVTNVQNCFPEFLRIPWRTFSAVMEKMMPLVVSVVVAAVFHMLLSPLQSWQASACGRVRSSSRYWLGWPGKFGLRGLFCVIADIINTAIEMGIAVVWIALTKAGLVGVESDRFSWLGLGG